jgi:NADPH:quinone reductase and related Zn-dependent oxidoreductases
VNPADPLTLSGKYAREWGTNLPLIPGYEIAGIIEKTGAKFTSLKPGDAVYGYPTFGGGWAEYVTVKEWEVAPKPKSLTFAEAAAVPMGALTAWQALVDVAQLHAGQTILIHGGSGGVGSFAVQIAKVRGARVIATASTATRTCSGSWARMWRSITPTKIRRDRERRRLRAGSGSAKTPLPDLTR